MNIYVNDTPECRQFLDSLESRAGETRADIMESVSKIVNDVRKNKDKALFAYEKEFDKVEFTSDTIEMKREDLLKKASEVPKELYCAMEKAAENIRSFHKKQLRSSFIDTERPGKITGQRIRPLARAGIYVPGGTAAYPSSVLMNCIPAKVAGVSEIIMVTPPRDGGLIPAVAAAAVIAGVDRVFMCGGAQAVAALAYGTETIPRVDIIAGPGNVYVATAKRLVYGSVNIDMIAGPSEVLVVADEKANPRFIAADLLSQAEHDALASSILVTNSKSLAEMVSVELEKQLAMLERKSIAEKSVSTFGAAIVCDSLDDALAIANSIAPEHLELAVENPMSYLGRVQNAGSVFLGEYSPEPLGDYFAGPNHVLPTNGTARFSSPLSVDDFVKKSGFVYYDRDSLKEYADDIICFAEAEGLTAHANSIRVRFDK